MEIEIQKGMMNRGSYIDFVFENHEAHEEHEEDLPS
jgi:hypothetical protein